MKLSKSVSVLFFVLSYVIGYTFIGQMLSSQHMTYAAALYTARGMIAITQEQYDQAIVYADQSLQESDNYFGHVIKAISYSADVPTRNTTMAEASLTNALNHRPDNLRLHLIRANNRLELGDFNGALVDLDYYLQREELADAYLSRAITKITIYKLGRNHAYLLSATSDLQKAKAMFHRENNTEQEVLIDSLLAKISNHEKNT